MTMSDPKIPELSRWIYSGTRGLQGLKHTVMSVDTQGVVTISDPLKKPYGEVAGESWMGSREEFFRQFKRVPGVGNFFEIFG